MAGLGNNFIGNILKSNIFKKQVIWYLDND
jgi:hypothetical protein